VSTSTGTQPQVGVVMGSDSDLPTMQAAVEAETGQTPKLSTTGGTSDARFIKDHCPVIEMGLVNATIHQVDERVPTTDLEALTRIYHRFLTLFFART